MRVQTVYACRKCGREVRRSEPAQTGQEPICPVDRQHGRTKYMRQE